MKADEDPRAVDIQNVSVLIYLLFGIRQKDVKFSIHLWPSMPTVSQLLNINGIAMGKNLSTTGESVVFQQSSGRTIFEEIGLSISEEQR